jgi:hypothetical protein
MSWFYPYNNLVLNRWIKILFYWTHGLGVIGSLMNPITRQLNEIYHYTNVFKFNKIWVNKFAMVKMAHTLVNED